MSKQSPDLPVQRLHWFDRPYLLLLLAILFWSGNIVLGRAVRAEIPPIGLAFWRWLVGSVLVLVLARSHLKPDLPQILCHWKIMTLFATLGVAMFNTFVYTGLRSTTAINGALLQAITPLIIVLLSYLLFREAISKVQAIGILISLAGVLVITTHGEWQTLGALSLNQGDTWIFAAVVGYAFYVTLQRLRPLIHPLSFLATTFVLGTGMILPFYVWEHMSGAIVQWNQVTIFSVLYVAIFPSILAYFCYDRGVLLIGANRAGQFLNLIPLCSSLMAILLLGETFQVFHGVGMVLILGGIWFVTQHQF